MAARTEKLERVAAGWARRLLLDGQGLLLDPARRASPAAVHRLIERLGFVQVDTINVVERAHHHILMSRLDGYHPRMLTKLLERDRTLFEHWTHDASVIPTAWLAPWKVRFARAFEHGYAPRGWWAKQLGDDPERMITHVLERIRAEGALLSKDFEHDRVGKSGGWWSWKPQKTALEYLWWGGRLAVSARRNFHKVYDLAERVYPQLSALEPPDAEGHRDWACRAALERLVLATPAEIAAYFAAIKLPEATAWCRSAEQRGDIVRVEIDGVDGSPPQKACALPDWRRHLERCPSAPRRIRILSPFDPVVRDRKRVMRRFGFEYRFEAFVPAAKRRYGYYVMPLLEGERLVGRLDAKLHRDAGRLEVKNVWWERGVKATPRRRGALRAALDRFVVSLDAETHGWSGSA